VRGAAQEPKLRQAARGLLVVDAVQLHQDVERALHPLRAEVVLAFRQVRVADALARVARLKGARPVGRKRHVKRAEAEFQRPFVLRHVLQRHSNVRKIEDHVVGGRRGLVQLNLQRAREAADGAVVLLQLRTPAANAAQCRSYIRVHLRAVLIINQKGGRRRQGPRVSPRLLPALFTSSIVIRQLGGQQQPRPRSVAL